MRGSMRYSGGLLAQADGDAAVHAALDGGVGRELVIPWEASAVLERRHLLRCLGDFADKATAQNASLYQVRAMDCF
jgi:hypothetical protein